MFVNPAAWHPETLGRRHEISLAGLLEVDAFLAEAFRRRLDVGAEIVDASGFHPDLVPVRVVLDGIGLPGKVLVVPQPQKVDAQHRDPAETFGRPDDPFVEEFGGMDHSGAVVGPRDQDLEDDQVWAHRSTLICSSN